MNKKSILQKTFHFGAITFLSRLLAFPREILQLRFLGVGILSDAFIAAFRLPNLFRRIFAEGALSAAFIPSYVQLMKKKKDKTASGTMSLSFIFFEGIVLCMCIFVFLFPHTVVKFAAPGFSPEQMEYAVPFLRILFPLLFFISSSALLSGALQSKNHFFAQSFGPVLHNIFYVGTLIYCLLFHKTPYTLAFGVLLGGVSIFILHITMYFRYRFRFGKINHEAIEEFKKILLKFLPCLVGIGIVEINLYLDGVISSFLPKGSFTLLYTANRFMNLPLGAFAVAFSTILLPHFSRVATYAPKRLHFYFLETAKFVTWIILPAMLFIMFSSKTIFSLILKNPSRTPEAAAILICYSSGLIFYCLNKVLINMFYSLHDTKSPTIASVVATLINLIFNIIGMKFFGAPGIALSTAISGLALTISCIFLLRKKHKFKLYLGNYVDFLWKYTIQLLASIAIFFGIHFLIFKILKNKPLYSFFYFGWGYWIFTIPLFIFTMMVLYLFKMVCKTNIYFLNK